MFLFRKKLPKYHWLPDLPDGRDCSYSRQRKRMKLSVDLRDRLSPVENQESLGSCTANALAGCIEAIDRSPDFEASRLFIYYNERKFIGQIGNDSGAYLRDGIKSLAQSGVCSEATWPYRTRIFREKPSCEAYKEALDHQITSYARLNSELEMRDCLSAGFPFVFGFTVYPSFESRSVALDGLVSLPEAGEVPLGGHAVCAVGYRQISGKSYFIVRNSWGSGWGDGGYCYMPFEYLLDPNLADDFWAIRGIEES